MILALRGLGECPAFAPYLLANGACSNVPPQTASAPPADVVQNTATGVYERVYTDADRTLQEALQSPGAAESSRDAALREQNEAIRQAQARGVPISCDLVLNSAPGVPGLWQSVCNVAGNPGNDAGLLIRPGGLEIAVTEARRVTGQPVSLAPSTPAYVPPATNQPGVMPAGTILPTAQDQASAATGRPNQNVAPRDTSVKMSTGITNTGAAMAAGQAVPEPAPVEGMPFWIYLAAGAAALFLIARGK